MTDLDEHGGWPGVLGRLASGDDLTADVTRAVLGTILDGAATDAQIAAFIVALRMKGESVEELVGLQGAMLDAAAPLDVPADTIDIVGMGGAPTRRTHALNVSTMASFVAAGAGATVCKHGNRRASSTSGSFDLLEALGVAVDVSPAELEAQVRDTGLGFSAISSGCTGRSGPSSASRRCSTSSVRSATRAGSPDRWSAWPTGRSPTR